MYKMTFYRDESDRMKKPLQVLVIHSTQKEEKESVWPTNQEQFEIRYIFAESVPLTWPPPQDILNIIPASPPPPTLWGHVL